MKNIAFLLLCLVLTGCSFISYRVGHYTGGEEVTMSPSIAGSPTCNDHDGRAQALFFTYYAPVTWVLSNDSAVSLAAPVVFALSFALDVACIPFAFVWGVESGIEDLISAEEPGVDPNDEIPVKPNDNDDGIPVQEHDKD